MTGDESIEWRMLTIGSAAVRLEGRRQSRRSSWFSWETVVNGPLTPSRTTKACAAKGAHRTGGLHVDAVAKAGEQQREGQHEGNGADGDDEAPASPAEVPPASQPDQGAHVPDDTSPGNFRPGPSLVNHREARCWVPFERPEKE